MFLRRYCSPPLPFCLTQTLLASLRWRWRWTRRHRAHRSSSDQKPHPYVFFSRRLSPTERNYDVGNRELLALVLALQEWPHRLEGSAQPFVVWTDHKNLTYLQSTKCLNSHQARWALFLGQFNFALTYRPRSKNTKPDALSCQFSAGQLDPHPGPILSPSCLP